MCTQFVRCTPWSSGESTWVQKTKLQKMSTTHSHERTHALTHPYTDLTTEPRTNLPTHGVLQHYSRYWGHTAGHACVGHAEFLPVSCRDFHFLTIPCHPEERAIRPREGLSTPPARPTGHGRPFFRRNVRGLLYGGGIAPTRDRRRPSGARDSQLFSGYAITGMFSRIRLDIITVTTTTTDKLYIIRILPSPC